MTGRGRANRESGSAAAWGLVRARLPGPGTRARNHEAVFPFWVSREGKCLYTAACRSGRVEGFSQGQRIKVALARAIVHNPKHVLLDEPTNGLDVMATRALRRIILKLKDEGRCVLFCSHVMQEVANLCDDVVIIGRGTVLFQGTLDELRTSAGETDLEEAFIQTIGEDHQ